MPFKFGVVTVCTIKFWSSKCFGPVKLELVIGLCLSNLEFIVVSTFNVGFLMVGPLKLDLRVVCVFENLEFALYLQILNF